MVTRVSAGHEAPRRRQDADLRFPYPSVRLNTCSARRHESSPSNSDTDRTWATDERLWPPLGRWMMDFGGGPGKRGAAAPGLGALVDSEEARGGRAAAGVQREPARRSPIPALGTPHPIASV
eukprot:2011546-Rhodomonas_salina.1